MSANNNNLPLPIFKIEVEAMVPDNNGKEILQKETVDLSGEISPNSTSEDISSFLAQKISLQNRIKTFHRYLRLVKTLNLD